MENSKNAHFSVPPNQTKHLIWYHWGMNISMLSFFTAWQLNCRTFNMKSDYTSDISFSLTFRPTVMSQTKSFFPHEEVLKRSLVELHAQDFQRLPCGHIQIRFVVFSPVMFISCILFTEGVLLGFPKSTFCLTSMSYRNFGHKAYFLESLQFFRL